MKRVMKRTLACFLMFAVLITSIPVTAEAEGLEVKAPGSPVFSESGGFYDKDLELQITSEADTQIRYTLDGSEPTLSSELYTESKPIQVKAPSNNPMLDGSGAGGKAYKNGMVVKAKTFLADGSQSSKTITNTYFINTEFSIPVISVSMEPEDFVGDKGMYSQWGQKLTPQGFVEFYDENGSLGFKHSAELKISGHYSKGLSKKSIRFNFTKGKYEGDKKLLEYDLYPFAVQNPSSMEKVTSHAKITARVSDWQNSTLKETLTAEISRFLRPETMDNVPSAVFINGEFWGIYELREQADNNFISQHYPGVKKGQVVALAFDWDTANPGYSSSEPLYRVSYDEGPDDQEETWYADFMEMYKAVTTKDLSIPENYEIVKQHMDIDNMIDYYLIYMFAENNDWPANNFKLWRTVDSKEDIYGHDGKWRFIVHDFDNAYSDINKDSILASTHYTTGHEPTQAEWALLIYRNLFKSEEFRNLYAARYSTYMGTAFSTERTVSSLNKLVSYRQSDIGKDFYRWNLHGGDISGSVENWKNGSISFLTKFLKERPDVLLNHIRNYYKNKAGLTELPDSYTQITFENDSTMGWLDVSGAQIRKEYYGAEIADGWNSKYIQTLPVLIKANPQEGYEFVKFEVIRGNGEREEFEGSDITLTPQALEETMSVKAIYKLKTDKTQLQSLYDAFKDIKKGDYTDKSWSEFTTVLINAKNILEKEDATQEEIDTAKLELENGKSSLKVNIPVPPKPVPKPKPPKPVIPKAKKVSLYLSGVASNQKGKTLYLKKGKKIKIKGVVSPAKAKQGVTYKSKNSRIASVSKTGLVSGKKVGSTTITITSKDKVRKTKLKIKIVKKGKNVKTLKVTSKKKFSLKVGKTSQIKTRIAPLSTTSRITYKVKNKKTLTVDRYGKIKAKKKGKTTITVKCQKKSVKLTVTVKK